MRKVELFVTIALFAPAGFAQSPGFAQGRASAGSHSPSVQPGFAQSNRFAVSGSNVVAGRFRGHVRGFRNPGLLYPWPYYDGFYSDYDTYEEPPAPSQPPPIQPKASTEPIPAPALLELQGNQWVKVNSFTMPSSSIATNAPIAAGPAKEMPPAVLVYRDGHTEELSNYTIIGDSIQTKANYWADGAWTRTIQIADLDLPSTLKQNQERGVKFDLPSGPNEVMIRP